MHTLTGHMSAPPCVIMEQIIPQVPQDSCIKLDPIATSRKTFSYDPSFLTTLLRLLYADGWFSMRCYQQARSPADGRTDVYLCRGYLNPEFQLGVSAYHAVLLLLAAILVWPAVH